MAAHPKKPIGRWLVIGLIVLAVVSAGAIAVAWTGIYNVAASRGHWRITNWFLEFGMRNSVAKRALVIEEPAGLADPDLVRLGAGHFHSGCAFCHGAPGLPVSPIASHMLPSPPDLSTNMRPWKNRELFWIVKHGIKYTGMPGWVAIERDDEVWTMVAFLKRLPQLDAQGYRDLAMGKVQVAEPSGRQLATSDLTTEAVSACARCHGADREGPSSALVPVLHGQPSAFLLASLEGYANGKRRSGIMQPMAADLTPEQMRRLADYYAALVPPAKPATARGTAGEVGRKLAETGATERDIPPCMSCHAGSALPAYPRLAGQNSAYMAGQLRVWKGGHNRSAEGTAIMGPIAERLTDEEIKSVAEYFASLAPDAREPRRP